jgi:DNA helicase-2/ATP-dependent DNA helicase PcrA
VSRFANQSGAFYGRKPDMSDRNTFDSDVHAFPDYDEEVPSANGEFAKGQRVRHPTFGVGSIFQTEGSGDQQKVSVLFSDQTIKKFVAKYARLERL